MIGDPGKIEGPQALKIETIKMPNGNEVSYCPERGGIIVSIKLQGKEILYLDETTFKDTSKNVKGGIPVLFPNAGPIKDPQFPDLKQHGFARNTKWQAQKVKSSFMQTLKADSDTKKVFPFDFSLSTSGQFEKDGSFSLSQSVQNLEQERVMPISMGLHPYFCVPHDAKKDIRFNFKGGKEIEEQFNVWSNDGTVSVDNPGTPLEIYIPQLGTLILDISKEYKKIWIWSLPNKDFVCIEPVMRNSGGLVDDPEKVQPGAVLNAGLNIKLKR